MMILAILFLWNKFWHKWSCCCRILLILCSSSKSLLLILTLIIYRLWIPCWHNIRMFLEIHIVFIMSFCPKWLCIQPTPTQVLWHIRTIVLHRINILPISRIINKLYPRCCITLYLLLLFNPWILLQLHLIKYLLNIFLSNCILWCLNSS